MVRRTFHDLQGIRFAKDRVNIISQSSHTLVLFLTRYAWKRWSTRSRSNTAGQPHLLQAMSWAAYQWNSIFCNVVYPAQLATRPPSKLGVQDTFGAGTAIALHPTVAMCKRMLTFTKLTISNTLGFLLRNSFQAWHLFLFSHQALILTSRFGVFFCKDAIT